MTSHQNLSQASRIARETTSSPRKRALLALLLTTSLSLGACAKLNDVTGSIGNPSAELPKTQDGVRLYTEAWGKRYNANSNDKTIGMNYAKGLRAQGQYSQAVAVLQNLAIRNSKDQDVLGAYGKALADAGQLQEAADVLKQAHTPDKPNWSILSSQGAVADQMGDHVSAQQFYLQALKIMPGDPNVLSNLGLSYALSRQLKPAEQALRDAAANPRADSRVRQNLALVLALQGKFSEAEELERRDLSPADAKANVAAIRQMIAQSNTWRQIQAQTVPTPEAGQRPTRRN